MKNEWTKPAFPADTQMPSIAKGLTKYEYFVAMAMQGYIVNGGLQGYGADTIASHAIATAEATMKRIDEKEQ